MKISYRWLQRHIEEPLPSPEIIRETIIFHAFEVESIDRIDDDVVFDIKVLPDRAHDCLSHRGIARELAGLLKLTLKPYEFPALPFPPSGPDLPLKLEVQTDVCRRYIGVVMEGVRVEASPSWLTTLLTAVGQKSINNIVDLTNFILLDVGQPVHVFDLESIDGGIVVRSAHDGEKIITLSDEEKQLTESMSVIADYVGALAIAGVKGGKTAEVNEKTTKIFLEIANFDPAIVRKTARSLGLVTDASKRFENDLTPERALGAAQALVAEVQKLAGGTIAGAHDWYPHQVEKRTISFTLASIVRILGPSITEAHIDEVFTRYHYEYVKQDGTYVLTVPSERLDLVGPYDIAEEIGRVVGYEHIVPAELPAIYTVEQNTTYQQIRAVRTYLLGGGFREVMTYTFRKKGEVYVARGPKDKSALRTNLSDALQESYELNRLNAPLLGLTDIKLFEIGTVFSADKEEIRVATIDKGTVQELPLETFITEHGVPDNIDFSRPSSVSGRFVPWSVYPFITRDIAVWVSTTEDKKILEQIVTAFAEKYCARPAQLFDTFEKEGKTSVAYRLVFQAPDKTLTEQEVETYFQELTKCIIEKKIFSIR